MKSILVVDDHPMNVAVARTVLMRAGFAVTTASSALEALEAVAHQVFDVVVTDISMPVTSGTVLCSELRARFGSSLRLVAYTALATEGELKELAAASFDAIVVKPATRDKLVAAMSSGTAASLTGALGVRTGRA